MIKKIKKFLWKTEGMEYSDSPNNKKGSFVLKLNDENIGYLNFSEGMWSFEYDGNFQNTNLKPIADFPDLSKKYQSEELWPFFATRIPSINQPYLIKKIEKAQANKNDSVDLLSIFGRDTITNPFKLFPVV